MIQEALREFSRYEVDVRPETETPRTALNLPGAPVLAFVDDFTKLPIHTAQDTIDLMGPEELAYTAEAVAAVRDRF